MYKERLNELGYIEAIPKPTAEELNRYYKEKYFQGLTKNDYYANSYTSDELEYFYNTARVAEFMLVRYGLQKSVLDLGCGEGYFSCGFKKLGWNVTCSDFSTFGITNHNPQMLPFFTEGDIYATIDNHVSQNRKFPAINLQNVLEHVVDPSLLLNKLKKIMDEESILRIRVPNDYSSFQEELVKRGMIKNTWFAPPEHLSYFNTNSLSNLLNHCGYQLLSVQTDFPIEIFLANSHSNYWQNRALGKGAHMARVLCENYLINKNIESYILLSEAAAKLEYGRELICYACMN